MSLYDLFIQWRFDNRATTHSEHVSALRLIDSQAKMIDSLNRKLEALESKLSESATPRLLEKVNSLQAHVDKLTARLIGFSKTGIS